MGSALYIVSKKKLSDYDMLMDGKSLARAGEALGSICTRIGVKQLMDFFSQNADELADILGDDVPDLPPEQWFEAKDGLATVRALLVHLAKDTTSIVSHAAVVEDLKQCERILAHLEKTKVRWHFAIDV